MKRFAVHDPDQPLATIQEVARRLGLTVRTVWRMISEGALPEPVRVGVRGTRFIASEIDAFIRGLPPSTSRRGRFLAKASNN